MSLAGLVAALAAAGAAGVALAPRPGLDRSPGDPAPAAARPDVVRRWRWAWSASALLGSLTLVSGALALPLGVGAAVGVWVLAGRAEPSGVRRTREAASAQLPHLVELFAAALAVGSAPGPALDQACLALAGPAADQLRATRAALALGVGPAQVWADLSAHPVLGQLGRAMTRAHASGAPVVEVTRQLADDLAAESRLAAEDAARAVGVRAAVPLGLCLLPAFLLLGIVPLVATAVAAISW